ncbi:MAG: hypothetical protein OK438_00430 [Thaumarchaeota archaeon]|nr:hypothetical protein [Nitrososphaerota archaeon]
MVTELQFRGLDQSKVDSALRCLVHVYVVQDVTASEAGGVIVQDVISTYPLDVVQAASDLFLERLKTLGVEVYRVKWGYEDAARTMEKQLWDNTSLRWEEFVTGMDDRYLGFVLPASYENARVVDSWKTRKDLKWLSVELPAHGWNVLRMVDDIVAVAWKLDLAFGFRPFGPNGAEGQRILVHKKAFQRLKEEGAIPPEELRIGINLWKFFSEYRQEESDFVTLMKDCGLTIEEVKRQIASFALKGLTSEFREGQYPPFLVNEKAKKEYQQAVRMLLTPMDSWLTRLDVPAIPEIQEVRA